MAYTTINKSTDHFNTVTYTGTGSAQSITGVGFRPDWVWGKNRSTTNYHNLEDVVRGAGKRLSSNVTEAETTESVNFTSFDSDGFTVGTGDNVNKNGSNIVVWNWLAGNSAGSSNTDGTINSTVSVNTTAGFSIVSYTGTGANATVGHGLGTAPKVVIVKNRTSAENWQVYHGSISGMSGGYITLNNTDGFLTNITNFWNGDHSSTVIDIGSNNGTNQSGNSLVAYCFAEKKGYSKFGSYTGNGNADGPFVYTGFKPAWVLVKNTSGSGDNWIIVDNKRLGYNPDNRLLFPNASNAEYTDNNLDLLSNGFKARVSYDPNGSGNTMIYMAFAESPFVNSNGVPINAR